MCRYLIIMLIVVILGISQSQVHAAPDRNGFYDIDVWPRFWQWESPWGEDENNLYAGKKIYRDGELVGKFMKDHGCLVTSFAMLYNYYGQPFIPEIDHFPKINPACEGKSDDYYCSVSWYLYKRTNPGTLNDWLTKNSLYTEVDKKKKDGTTYKAHELDTNGLLKKFYLHAYNLTINLELKHSCNPIISNGDCSRLDWSNENTERLLDYDLTQGQPDIMKIKWWDSNGDPHDSHFVLIGGYDWDSNSYRAYDPNKRYNQFAQYPPGLKTLYAKQKRTDLTKYVELRVDRYQSNYRFNYAVPDQSRLTHSVFSPVHAQVISPDGNITGYDPDTNIRVSGVKRAYYSEESEPSVATNASELESTKVLFIDKPDAGNYIFKLFGTGDGPYTIKLEGIARDGSINLDTSFTGTAYVGLRDTYRIKYSPTGEATLSHDNQPPIADAGPAQTGEQGYEIALDGSASHDPDGDPLKLSWTFVSKPSGSQAALSDPAAIRPIFTPDLPGTYVLQLGINDYFTDGTPGSVTITALPIKSRLTTAPNLDQPLHAGSGVMAFDVTNTGRAGVSSGRIEASLADPAGVVVWSGGQNFALPVGQSTVVHIPADLPALKFGNYTLTFSQTDETRTGQPATAILPSSATATFTFDQLAYHVRESAKLTLALANIGTFDLDNTTVTLALPDAGFYTARTLNAWHDETLAYDLPLPSYLAAGQHDVTVTLSLPSGSTLSQSAKLTVPNSALRIDHAGPTAVQAGDSVVLGVANPGGVDTSYAAAPLQIVDGAGHVLLQQTTSGTVLSGESATLATLTLPEQTASGSVMLSAAVTDSKTGTSSSLKVPLEVSGLTASLSARTDKEHYLATDPVAAFATVATGMRGIDDGRLETRIKRYTPVREERMTDFLPKNWWPLGYPFDVAVSADGYVYVINGGSAQVVKFDAQGNYVSAWGSEWLSELRGIALSDDGYVYVTDTGQDSVFIFTTDGNFVKQFGGKGTGNGQFEWPSKIAVAPDGTVYVSDSYNGRVQSFDKFGNYLSQFGAGLFLWPWGIGVNNDGNIYVIDGGCTMSSCGTHHRILKFDRYGNYLAQWGGRGTSDGKFDTPWGLTVAPDGSVYVADSYNYRIQRFDGNGNFLGKWGRYGVDDGEFDWVEGLSVASDGSVYVADMENNRIQRFDAVGNFIGRWGQEFDSPKGIALDDAHSVYVTDSDNGRVMKYDSSGSHVATIGQKGIGNGEFYKPYDVAVSRDGHIYVADSWNHRIHKFSADGEFLLRWGATGSGWGSPGSGDGFFNNPVALAVAPDNRVFVVDQLNHRVQIFTASGQFLSKFGGFGSGPGQFNEPSDIAITDDGTVYVVDRSNHRVQKFDGDGHYLAQWGELDDWWTKTDGRFLNPSTIAIAPDGAVYIGSDSRIQKFDGNGNFLGKFEDYGSGPGEFFAADGLAVASDGTLYLADARNNRIQRTRSVVIAANEQIVQQQSLPLSQSAASTQEYPTDFSALSAPGKYYLDAQLLNRLNQTIARAEYPFHVVAGDASLEFVTDKPVYQPGETVVITGTVGNRSSLPISPLLVEVMANDTSLYTAPFELAAGESRTFTTTTVAAADGNVALLGKARHGDVVLAETVDHFEVAGPRLALAVTAPGVVGKDPFAVQVFVTNNGKFSYSCQLSLNDGTSTGEQQSLVVSPGETRQLVYQRQISENRTYIASVSGDTTTASAAVGYGEAAAILLGTQYVAPPPRSEPVVRGKVPPPPDKPPVPAPAPTFVAGHVAVPVTVMNIGLLSEQVVVEYALSGGDGSVNNEVRTYYLQPGENRVDRLDYDLPKGEYLLSATSQLPAATSQYAFTVYGYDVAAMATTLASPDGSGLAPLTISVVNQGQGIINGSVAVAVMGNAGKALWRGEVPVINLVPLASQSAAVQIETAALLAGAYRTEIDFFNASGRKLAANVEQLRVPGAIFEIVSGPVQPTFTVGKPGSLTYVVKNSGTQAGTTRFTVKASEWLNDSVTESFAPGEVKNLTFNFSLPEDVAAGDYPVDYALLPSASQSTLGQSVVGVAEVRLAVTATLDKVAYKTDDTAIVELTAAKQGEFDDGEYIAIIRYGAYHDLKPINVGAVPASVAFAVPLPLITGESLFYSLHFPSGRTISQGVLPINRAQADLASDELQAVPGSASSFSLSAPIMNYGELPTQATTVAFFDGDPLGESHVEIGRRQLSALAAGQAMTVALDWYVLGQAGTHEVYVQVDPDDLVTERSEANNIRMTEVTVPDFTLNLATVQPQYRAEQQVAIIQTVANLTPAQNLTDAELFTIVKSPDGNEVASFTTTIPSLIAGEATFAGSWETADNSPGLYRIESELRSELLVLTDATTSFEILPTMALTGLLSAPPQVVRGQQLELGYVLRNKGNVAVEDGEIRVEVVLGETQEVVMSLVQPLPALAVRASEEDIICVAKIELEPGVYTVRLRVQVSGATHEIAAQELRVLPPLEVAVGISTASRVLVLLDKEGSGRDTNANKLLDLRKEVITWALIAQGVYYRTVEDRAEFKREMRSGIYNQFILASNDPLQDHLDAELRERIFAGDGLLLMNYRHVTDSKVRNTVAAKSLGSLPDAQRSLVAIESSWPALEEIVVTGKIERLAATHETDIAATISDKGTDYPGIIVNDYGHGTVVTFAFDVAVSADAHGSTAPYSQLVADALSRGPSTTRKVIPGVPFGFECLLKGVGQPFALRVVEPPSPDFQSLLTYPAATIVDGVPTWQVDISGQVTKRLLQLVKVPEHGGVFQLPIEVYYRNSGEYVLLGRYVTEVRTAGLTALEMEILARIQSLADIKSGEVASSFRGIIERLSAQPDNQALDREILNLLKLIGVLENLTENTSALHHDLIALLQLLERRWVEAL